MEVHHEVHRVQCSGATGHEDIDGLATPGPENVRLTPSSPSRSGGRVRGFPPASAKESVMRPGAGSARGDLRHQGQRCHQSEHRRVPYFDKTEIFPASTIVIVLPLIVPRRSRLPSLLERMIEVSGNKSYRSSTSSRWSLARSP